MVIQSIRERLKINIHQTDFGIIISSGPYEIVNFSHAIQVKEMSNLECYESRFAEPILRTISIYQLSYDVHLIPRQVSNTFLTPTYSTAWNQEAQIGFTLLRPVWHIYQTKPRYQNSTFQLIWQTLHLWKEGKVIKKNFFLGK